MNKSNKFNFKSEKQEEIFNKNFFLQNIYFFAVTNEVQKLKDYLLYVKSSFAIEKYNVTWSDNIIFNCKPKVIEKKTLKVNRINIADEYDEYDEYSNGLDFDYVNDKKTNDEYEANVENLESTKHNQKLSEWSQVYAILHKDRELSSKKCEDLYIKISDIKGQIFTDEKNRTSAFIACALEFNEEILSTLIDSNIFDNKNNANNLLSLCFITKKYALIDLLLSKDILLPIDVISYISSHESHFLNKSLINKLASGGFFKDNNAANIFVKNIDINIFPNEYSQFNFEENKEKLEIFFDFFSLLGSLEKNNIIKKVGELIDNNSKLSPISRSKNSSVLLYSLDFLHPDKDYLEPYRENTMNMLKKYKVRFELLEQFLLDNFSLLKINQVKASILKI